MAELTHINRVATAGVLSAYDPAFQIFDRRDGERNRNQATVLALGASAQVNCDAIPHGPEGTDFYLAVSQF